MAQRLFLFTHHFPFAGGEEFLEAELPYLCREFDSVQIIPTGYLSAEASGPEHLRPVPAGAVVRTDLVERIRSHRAQSKVARAKRAATDGDTHSLMARETWRVVQHGPEALRRIPQFLDNALLIRDIAAELVADSNRGQTVLYAYWMMAPALGLSLLPPSANLLRICRAHGGDLYHSRHEPPYLPFQRETLRRLDRVFTISEHGKNYLAGHYPDLADRLEVGRLGVPAALERARPSDDGVLRLLSCSSIDAVKHLRVLVAALRRLTGVAVHWTHIGDGPLADGLRTQSQLLPKNVGVELKGQLPHDQVLQYYRAGAVDAFVNVSLSEGVPVSIMEALSFGVPVIAPAVGGIPELIDGSCGVLMPTRPSPRGIITALTHLHELPVQDKEVMRDQACDRWQALASADRNYTSFAARLRHLTEAASL